MELHEIYVKMLKRFFNMVSDRLAAVMPANPMPGSPFTNMV